MHRYRERVHTKNSLNWQNTKIKYLMQILLFLAKLNVCFENDHNFKTSLHDDDHNPCFKTSKYKVDISCTEIVLFLAKLGCMNMMIIIMVMNTFARKLPPHSSPLGIARQMLGEEAEAGLPFSFNRTLIRSENIFSFNRCYLNLSPFSFQ